MACKCCDCACWTSDWHSLSGRTTAQSTDHSTSGTSPGRVSRLRTTGSGCYCWEWPVPRVSLLRAPPGQDGIPRHRSKLPPHNCPRQSYSVVMAISSLGQNRKHPPCLTPVPPPWPTTLPCLPRRRSRGPRSQCGLCRACLCGS